MAVRLTKVLLECRRHADGWRDPEKNKLPVHLKDWRHRDVEVVFDWMAVHFTESDNVLLTCEAHMLLQNPENSNPGPRVQLVAVLVLQFCEVDHESKPACIVLVNLEPS